jgi:hypothetical protein
LPLPAHEPGRLAVTHSLLDFGQGEADVAQPAEVIRCHHAIVPLETGNLAVFPS